MIAFLILALITGYGNASLGQIDLRPIQAFQSAAARVAAVSLAFICTNGKIRNTQVCAKMPSD